MGLISFCSIMFSYVLGHTIFHNSTVEFGEYLGICRPLNEQSLCIYSHRVHLKSQSPNKVCKDSKGGSMVKT